MKEGAAGKEKGGGGGTGKVDQGRELKEKVVLARRVWMRHSRKGGGEVYKL